MGNWEGKTMAELMVEDYIKRERIRRVVGGILVACAIVSACALAWMATRVNG